MTTLTTENLIRCCEVATTRASWKEIMSSCGASESLAYNWLSRSKRDASEHLEGASPFYVEIAPHGFDYFHNHIKRSRAAFIMGMEAEIRDQVRGGIVETCYDPSTGRPLLALDPKYIGVTDAQMDDDFLIPSIDRYLWNRDAQGERTTPIYQTRVVQAPGQLKIKALSALLPQTYGERATVDHNVRGAVVHVISPSPFISRESRIASGEVTDAEFTEVQATGLERGDIAQLRQRAKLLLETPLSERHTLPEAGQVVRDGSGDPVNVGRKPVVVDTMDDSAPLVPPTIPLRDHPRAYIRPTPAPAPQSSNGFPRHSDPTRAGSMARKVG
jgi:hypothetical protein